MTSLPEPPASPAGAGGRQGTERADLLAMKHARQPHYLRFAAAAVIVLVAAFWVQGLAKNQALDWGVVGKYLFDDSILQGLERTLIITVVSIVIAVILGGVLANMRLSRNPVLHASAWGYVWFFRSIPLLVLLILVYNVSLIYPQLSVGIPFGHAFADVKTQNLLTPMVAAIGAFALQQSAYTSEVLRASILSVPVGQREAAHALGMTNTRIMMRIVFPQAIRVAIPPIANETINLLKSTALVAFIAVPDLLYSVQQIYSSTFQVVPLLIVATIWYAVVVSVLSVVQFLLERALRNARGRTTRQDPATKILETPELAL